MKLATPSMDYILKRVQWTLAAGPEQQPRLGDGERAVYEDMPSYVALVVAASSDRFFSSVVRYLTAPNPRRSGERALDVGCGTGHGSLVLKWKGYAVDAVDKCPDALTPLSDEDVTFHLSTIEEFDPPLNYDLITCCDCLEHLEDPAAALRLIHSWLSPGGRFYMTIPIQAPGTDSRWHRQWWQRDTFMALLDECWTIEHEMLEAPQNAFWGLASPKPEVES